MMYGKNSACNAPFNNMYFTVDGKVGPCWKTPAFCDEWSPERSIMDIWKGEGFQRYRDALSKNQFIGKCETHCKKNIDEGVWPLAKAYQDYSVKEYPTLMELELSNKCNLECIMCVGIRSNLIRKNRDKLPPLPQIYNDAFVEQMREFLPHLEELRFNGGEPFAQKIVLDICNLAAEVSPNLKINMATNGLVVNKRVRHILEHNNIHLNISIDSLQKERYESIRINGDFDKLIENVNMFADYCKTNKRNLAIMVNPMRNNWDEMIDFVKFTEDLGSGLWYNTILHPKHLAIWNLETDQLKEIYEGLNNRLDRIHRSYRNYGVADHLVNDQIKNWLLDSYVR